MENFTKVLECLESLKQGLLVSSDMIYAARREVKVQLRKDREIDHTWRRVIRNGKKLHRSGGSHLTDIYEERKMNSESGITNFLFTEDNHLGTIVNEGRILFSVGDVCRILGTNSEVGFSEIDIPSYHRETVFVKPDQQGRLMDTCTVAGVKLLCNLANNPVADRLYEWIVTDVIPIITETAIESGVRIFTWKELPYSPITAKEAGLAWGIGTFAAKSHLEIMIKNGMVRSVNRSTTIECDLIYCSK